MTEKIKCFDIPTQVKFWDPDGDHYVGGIGFGTQVICGCCGGTFDIDELYELAPEDVEPIIEMDWIDISNEIIGE